jgi:nitroimidazol reductase NimA-like FMN-containing flavoprotein (pyridoxamine 5'-phosphate oxidase superfamily)
MIESPEMTSDSDVPVPSGPPKIARTRSPRVVTLTDAQCRKLLSRNYVGRLAYTFRDAVDIVPIHYAYEKGWIYARTSPGQKLTKLRHNRWVAFEVDEVYGMLDWSSVVVRGALYVLDSTSATTDVLEAAIATLRKRFPTAFTDQDPVSFRTALFRIHVDAITGRRATPACR